MSSTTEFEPLIASAARGSLASLRQLCLYVRIHHCSERQIERLLTALYIRLDRRHMLLPSGITNGEHYQPALLSLHCLEILVFKDLARAAPSIKLVDSLTNFWPTAWSWIKLMCSFIIDDREFALSFRLQAKSVVLSVLRYFSGYNSLKAVIRGTPDVFALVFELWNLEVKDYNFDPSNSRNLTAPAVVTMNCYFSLMLEENFDWKNNLFLAVGRSATDVASVALTHLRHDAQQTVARQHLFTILADVKMIACLSFYPPLQHAILSQHCVLEVTRVVILLSSREYSTATSREMGLCLTICFEYLLRQLTFGDVWTWTIQALDGQLLRAILASEPWQTQFDNDRVLLNLSDAITKNLTTRLVTLAAARAVKKVRADGLEDRFLTAGDGPLAQKWLNFKEVVKERVLLIPWDDECRNRNRLRACDNHKCRRKEETEGSFKRCGGCLSSHYCSSLCQKEHWKREHKTYCQRVQACRQGGAVCPWSARDDHFMSTIMNNDLKIRHYEVHAVKRSLDLDIVVVDFDYTVVPFKMTVGSLTSCPLDDNGEREIRAKWDGMVDHARRTNSNLIKRWLVPTGETSKLMMEAGNIVCRCDDDTDVGDDLPNDTTEIESAGRDYSSDAEGIRSSLLALGFSGT